MPRTRQYRRHKRAVKLARRYRIVREAHRMIASRGYPWELDARAMNFHLRCNCFDEPRRLELRREERRWRREEGLL